MRITSVETIPVSVPIAPERAVTGAAGSHTRSPFLLVLVHTDAGIVGLGEASCTPVWSGEDSVVAAHVIAAYLAPAIVGEDPRDVTRLTARMQSAVAANHFAKAALEMALWDLAGKAAGLPVYQLLGGRVRDGVRTKFSVGGRPPDEAAAIAAWAVAAGFPAMKVKVGMDVAGDLARVAAVRTAVGDDVWLGVDANCGWSRAQARRAIAELAQLDIAFVEQPIAAADLAGMAELRRTSPVPIVADEAVGTPADALAVVRADAADVLSIYCGMAGGIAAGQRIAAIAATAGLGWTIGSNLELGIGLAAHLHLAIAAPGLADELVPCDIISTFYYEADILAQPLDIAAGWATPSDRPGLGVELDHDVVDRFREDR
jgi:L-alanine-DL-glutamate epimerase-like enolase superfamily enzyme